MHKKKLVTLVASGALMLGIAGGSLKAWGEAGEQGEAKEAKVTLPKAQLKKLTATALKAKPGKVVETEVETEGGKTHCDVVILAADGKKYEVEVDVATNKVVAIEEDNDKAEAGETDNDQDEHEGSEAKDNDKDEHEGHEAGEAGEGPEDDD